MICIQMNFINSVHLYGVWLFILITRGYVNMENLELSKRAMRGVKSLNTRADASVWAQKRFMSVMTLS